MGLSVRAAHLDTTHGFFNGTGVFLRPLGWVNSAPEVISCRPGSALPPLARCDAMCRAGAERHGFGAYAAADYDD